MSQDHGGRLVRHISPRPSAKHSLDRPSLFAEMDSAINALDGDTQRVRILSTLESARHAPRLTPAKRRLQLKLPHNWQIKILMGLMATGLLTLLAAFAMIVLNGHQVMGQSDAAADTAVPARASKPVINIARADLNNPLAALMAAPPTASSSAAQVPAAISATAVSALLSAPAPAPAWVNTPAPQAAVIETIEPPPERTVPNSKPALHVVLAAQSKHPAMLAASAANASTTRSIDATAYAVMTSAKSAAKPNKRSAPSTRKDEDVALLEAMFAHTGNRASTAPPQPMLSAAEEIKTRCDVQSGAAAATCRARVCVQNPSAPVCHQDP